MDENENVIQGACCGDCAACELMRNQDTTACASRIILIRVNKLTTELEDLKTGLSILLEAISNNNNQPLQFVDDTKQE